MGTKKCFVCGKDVRDGDETEHLRSNHLGPHYFWFDAKKYRTQEPSLAIDKIVEIVGGVSAGYQVYLESKDGSPDVGCPHGTTIDLTREPSLFSVPPATFRSAAWI